VTFQPMPDLTPGQYDALRDDIARNGVLVPVVVDQHGRILDGHNRKRIADELGVECPTATHKVSTTTTPST
jgi:ParB-like chromosome segregation protein Spo0J